MILPRSSLYILFLAAALVNAQGDARDSLRLVDVNPNIPLVAVNDPPPPPPVQIDPSVLQRINNQDGIVWNTPFAPGANPCGPNGCQPQIGPLAGTPGVEADGDGGPQNNAPPNESTTNEANNGGPPNDGNGPEGNEPGDNGQNNDFSGCLNNSAPPNCQQFISPLTGTPGVGDQNNDGGDAASQSGPAINTPTLGVDIPSGNGAIPPGIDPRGSSPGVDPQGGGPNGAGEPPNGNTPDVTPGTDNQTLLGESPVIGAPGVPATGNDDSPPPEATPLIGDTSPADTTLPPPPNEPPAPIEAGPPPPTEPPSELIPPVMPPPLPPTPGVDPTGESSPAGFAPPDNAIIGPQQPAPFPPGVNPSGDVSQPPNPNLAAPGNTPDAGPDMGVDTSMNDPLLGSTQTQFPTPSALQPSAGAPGFDPSGDSSSPFEDDGDDNEFSIIPGPDPAGTATPGVDPTGGNGDPGSSRIDPVGTATPGINPSGGQNGPPLPSESSSQQGDAALAEGQTSFGASPTVPSPTDNGDQQQTPRNAPTGNDDSPPSQPDGNATPRQPFGFVPPTSPGGVPGAPNSGLSTVSAPVPSSSDPNAALLATDIAFSKPGDAAIIGNTTTENPPPSGNAGGSDTTTGLPNGETPAVGNDGRRGSTINENGFPSPPTPRSRFGFRAEDNPEDDDNSFSPAPPTRSNTRPRDGNDGNDRIPSRFAGPRQIENTHSDGEGTHLTPENRESARQLFQYLAENSPPDVAQRWSNWLEWLDS